MSAAGDLPSDLSISSEVEEEEVSPEEAPEPSGGASFVYRVNSVLPEAQTLVTVEPGTTAMDALQLMSEMGFSQLPIVKGREVIGVFSFRSFALSLVQGNHQNPGAVAVEDAMEEPVWVRATDQLAPVFDVLDRVDAVLVGAENDLQGIVTTMDVLRHLDGLAEPFLRFREIERALRALIAASLRPEELAAIAKEALSHEYESRADDPPETADDMTLGELVAVVMHGASWKHFKQTLGDNRQTAQTHLADLPRLRNDLFHFRRELEPEELAQIQAASEWLRLRVRASGLMQGADE